MDCGFGIEIQNLKSKFQNHKEEEIMKKFLWIMMAWGISAGTALYTTPLDAMCFSFGVFVGGAGLAVFEWIDANISIGG